MSDAPIGLALRASGPLAPLQRWALWAAELSGWRRGVLAMMLGALAALALPPIDLTPLLLVAFSGLVWLADGALSRRAAFALGWNFGFGFFLVGLYWITAALFVDIAQFWWLVPFALLGAPAGFALFTGAAVWAALEARRLFHLRGSARIIVLAVAWAAAEWLRGHIFTGFPWNLVGYAWAGDAPGGLEILQTSAVIGIYGLSLLTVLAAALPARLGDLGRGRHWAPAVTVLLVALAWGGGAWRLAHGDTASVPGVRLRLAQPSIPQTLKNDPEALHQNLERLLALSTARGADAVTDVIWPEAAAPPLLERYADLRAALAHVVPQGGLLITGTVRGEPLTGPLDHVWNSLAVLDDSGKIVASYDKFHLVPFGEYVPLAGLLPMNKITGGAMGFDEGPGPRTLDLPGLPPVSPLICYEAIFPGAVIDRANRPQWLLNITNDAWYGESSGPYQHFAIARVRAVEEGLPLVRAANNGISGVIDGYGRVLARLGLDYVGVLDEPLPRALAPTLYEQFRDSALLTIALLLLAAAGILSRFNGRAVNSI